MNFESFKKNRIKTLFLLPMVFTLMGNQKSCEQQPEAQKRQLKRIVEIQKIASPSVNFGASGSFDFEFVANAQLIGVLQNSGDFAFRLMPPVQVSPSPARFALDGLGMSPESKTLNLVGSDRTLMKSWLAAPSQKPAVLATQSTEAWCMVNKPQATISGSVNSFELLGGAGLSVGFSPVGSHAVSADMAKVGFEFFQLDLSLNATSPGPLFTNLASSNVTSKQTKTRLGIGLNLGGLTMGPSFYFQTPLARVTKTALIRAVNQLRAKFKPNDWYTRVLANKDEDLMIVGGENVNLKVGDELAIYNELYTWSGDPCDSTLQYDGIAKYPVAKGVVNTVGRDVSLVTLTHEDEERVQIGATVRLVRLVEDIPTPPTPAK